MKNNYKLVNFRQLDLFYKEKFNNKVVKIPLTLNATCPNRDGLLDYTGCLFCNNKLSGDFTFNLDIKDQFQKYLQLINNKWPNGVYLPYFQSGSNTYGDYNYLVAKYEEAININKKVIGLAIATRFDTLDDKMINYLITKSKDYFIQLEIGLQSVNKDHIKLNRYFDKEKFINTIKKFSGSNIHLVIHIINGLPYETEEEMLKTIEFINFFDAIKGIKIHMLNILKDAPLYQIYLDKPFPILSMDQYLDIVIKQIRMLRPDIIIHRLTGDGAFNNLVEPQWIKRKFVVLNNLNKILWEQGFYQGDCYKKIK